MSFFGGAITQLADEYAGDPRTGLSIVKRWRGTPTQILAQANAATTLGLRYDVQELSQGGHQEIRVYYGAIETQDPDEPLADLWTLDANENEKSIWYSDTLVNMFNTGSWTTQDMADLRADIEQLFDGNGTVDDILAMPGLSGGEVTIIDGLIGALMRGVEVKPVSAPVVRRRLVVTYNTNLRPDITGVDKLISRTNFEAGGDPSGTPPATILFGLRNGWWNKKHPKVDQTSSTLWEINQEWHWIGDVYDAFVWETYGA